MPYTAFRKVMAFVAVIMSVVLFPACMAGENFVQSVLLTSDIRGAFVADPQDHFSVFDMSPSFSVGGYELYFDETNGNIGVFDSVSKVFWTALPTVENHNAAIITVEAFNGTATYVLNSQDHSVAFGTFSAEVYENRIKIVFSMADRLTTAEKSFNELIPGDVFVSVPLEIIFNGDRMTVDIDMANVIVSPGLILHSISILPYFGAVDNENKTCIPGAHVVEKNNTADAAAAEEPEGTQDDTELAETDGPDDFILVPDGCGGIIRTGVTAEKYPELDFYVYGSDDLLGRKASLGAFGIKKDGAAFVCVDTEGEELAVVKTSEVADAGNECYVVYSQYNVTPAFNNNGTMLYGLMYMGKISQTYSFLNGSSAGYPGMAVAAREILIFSGVLTSKPVEESIPVNIELIGSVDGKSDTVLTSFGQAESVLSQLNAKGLNNVALILNGFLNGGLFFGELSHSSVPSGVGGKKALNSLCDYARTMGDNIYLGTNVLSTSKNSAASKRIDGNDAKGRVVNPFWPVGTDSYQVRRIAPANISKHILSFIKKTGAFGITGYALCDCDISLSADYTSRQWSRTAVADMLSACASSFSSSKKLLVNGSNLNLLRNVDVITGIPYYTSVRPGENYEAVPFLQMIIHSSAVYSGSPVMGVSEKTELLKAVEYGGVPYFSWTGSRTERSYDNFIFAAADYCNELSKTVGDLAYARMTDHRKLADGVYCTVYNGTTLVYVNYNSVAVNVGGIDVPAYGYIRIN